jgi:uncharacterized membrane protein
VPGIITTGVQYTVDIGRLFADRRGSLSVFAQADAIAPLLIGIVIIVVLLLFIFSFAWHVTFMFALPLVAEHNLSVTDTIKLSAKAGWSNPGGILLLVILQIVWMLLGMLALCIGIFFVLPLIYASNIVAYRMVFPDFKPELSYQEPPRPDAYGGAYGTGM